MPQKRFHTVILPTRPQPDTLVAILLLRIFGSDRYPGVAEAKFESWGMLPEGETPESLIEKGYFLLDVGGSKFDHHVAQSKVTASQLVADDLGISADPAIAKLLQYAERDDKYGKGTISTDPLDRAFGLSGLVAAVNKSLPNNTQRVVELVLPLLLAHYKEEKRRTVELPKEFEGHLASGTAEVFEARHYGKKIKVVMVTSASPSLAGWLRSGEGLKADVVAQYLPSGHLNILTRPAKHIDLRDLAALIRGEESALRGRDAEFPLSYLVRTGRLDEVPEWYYDRATNSLQNGGLNPGRTPPTAVPRVALKKILSEGLAGEMHGASSGEVEPVEAPSPPRAPSSGMAAAESQQPACIAFDEERFTLILELADEAVSAHDLEVQAAAEGLSRKEELHITVLGFAQGDIIKKTLEAFSPAERGRLAAELKVLVHRTDWHYAPHSQRYVITKTYQLRDASGAASGAEEVRRSYIQMVQLPAIVGFYRDLNALLGTRLKTPPPHITLFTTGSGEAGEVKQGIALNTWEDFEKLHPQPL